MQPQMKPGAQMRPKNRAGATDASTIPAAISRMRVMVVRSYRGQCCAWSSRLMNVARMCAKAVRRRIWVSILAMM